MTVKSLSFLFLVLAILASLAAADTHENCVQWAETGECEKNPDFMWASCREACDRVTEVAAEQEARVGAVGSFFDLTANTLHGEPLSFKSLEGKIVVITNVASYCGYTESHYRGLVELWSHVKNEEVAILAFPCNQFGKQEPGTAEEIASFAKSKGVEFTMMEKINVNGPNTSLVYLYLKYKAGGPAQIAWNFNTYFVVSSDGMEITAYTGVEPMQLKDTLWDMLGKEEL